MTIKARDKGWQATVHHRGRRWRRQFDVYQEAEQWEAQARADVLQGKEPARERQYISSNTPKTLGDIIAYTAVHEWADKKSSEHLVRNAELVGDIMGMDTDVRHINNVSIDNLIQSLKQQGNGNGTINRKLASLSKCLTTAVHLGVIDKKPRIKRLREALNRVRWYSDDELERMIQFCISQGNARFGLWLRFQADTGLRFSETLSLRWEDIQDNVAVLTDTKGDKPRGVPLTKGAQDAVRNAYGNRGPFDWATKSHIRQWWNRIRLHMQWDDDKQAVPHALRHTFVSRLVQRGVPILSVKELAGHKTIDVTLKYAHLAPHNLKSAIDVLEPTEIVA